MAETFPFDVRATKLGIVSGIAFGRDEGGLVITSRHVEPYWSGNFATPPLTRSARIEALALLDDWVDLNRRVDVIHPLYTYPIGYTQADWPMIGDAALSSVSNLRTIVVSGLSVGLTLRAGSRLAIIQGDTVCYRKIRTTVVVGSAISQTVEIGPRLPPGVFAPAAFVRLKNPFVRMMLIPDSWDADEDIDETPLSFDMAETLR